VDAQSDNLTVASRLQWHRSSVCGSDACVEVAISDNRAFVRRSTDPAGTHLVFDAQEWRSFLAGARGHEFDID
jgi:hypothetical protein